MRPCNDQQSRLQKAAIRRCHPKGIQDLRVAPVDAEGGVGDPGPREVIGQQRGHCQTQQKLSKFRPGPMQHAPLVERKETQREVHEEGAIKHCRADLRSAR